MKLATTRSLFDYWNSLRGDNAMPHRRQIDPAMFKEALPQVFILERRDEFTYPFRIAGTGLCSHFGRELTGGDFLAMWSHAEREGLESLLLSITDDGACSVLGITGETECGRTLEMEAVLMPLMLDAEHAIQVIGAITPYGKEYWFGHESIVRQSIKSLRLLWPDGIPAPVLDSRPAAPDRPASHPSRGRTDAAGNPRLVVIDGGLSGA